MKALVTGWALGTKTYMKLAIIIDDKSVSETNSIKSLCSDKQLLKEKASFSRV